MKTYVLTLSKVFPKTHKRAGEETKFETYCLLGIKSTRYEQTILCGKSELPKSNRAKQSFLSGNGQECRTVASKLKLRD